VNHARLQVVGPPMDEGTDGPGWAHPVVDLVLAETVLTGIIQCTITPTRFFRKRTGDSKNSSQHQVSIAAQQFAFLLPGKMRTEDQILEENAGAASSETKTRVKLWPSSASFQRGGQRRLRTQRIRNALPGTGGKVRTGSPLSFPHTTSQVSSFHSVGP
jgi:hypothetical protein